MFSGLAGLQVTSLGQLGLFAAREHGSIWKEARMSRRYVVGVIAVGLLALGGWALAQQERPGANTPEPKVRNYERVGAPAQGGQFAVAPAGDSAVLVDTRSGKTWVLHRSVQGDSVWLPAKRLDSQEEALRWRGQE
jgi:hypothetical protein